MLRNYLVAAGITILGVLPSVGWAREEPILRSSRGSSPELGDSSHAVQGETIYSKFKITEQVALRLLQDVDAGKKAKFSRGDVLRGYVEGTTKRFCVRDSNQKYLGIHTGGRACLILSPSGEHLIARFLIADGATVGRRKPLQKAATQFEVTTLPDSVGDGFRNEIVFQGAAGGILRLLYREFNNDMARPAFSQELTYDLVEEGPLTIFVKGAKLEVISANNSGIVYRMIQGFE